MKLKGRVTLEKRFQSGKKASVSAFLEIGGNVVKQIPYKTAVESFRVDMRGKDYWWLDVEIEIKPLNKEGDSLDEIHHL